MAIQILHNNEVGTSLTYANGALNVQPDNSGNVQLEVTGAGLKAQVDIPEFDPSALNAKIAQLEADKATLEAKVTALENREDLHATGLSLDDATNEVVLTVQGGQELRVGLGKFLNIIPSSSEIYAEIKAQIIADVKDALKGEEVQDFQGNLKGYLITQ